MNKTNIFIILFFILLGVVAYSLRDKKAINSNSQIEVPYASMPDPPSPNASHDEKVEWRKKFDAFLAYSRHSMDTDPLFAHQRGTQKLEKGDIDGAINDFTQNIEKEGLSYEVSYFARGIAYMIKDKNWKAISDFSSCIDLNPDDYNSYHQRGLAKMRIWILKGSGCRDLKKAKALGDNDVVSDIIKYCD